MPSSHQQLPKPTRIAECYEVTGLALDRLRKACLEQYQHAEWSGGRSGPTGLPEVPLPSIGTESLFGISLRQLPPFPTEADIRSLFVIAREEIDAAFLLSLYGALEGALRQFLFGQLNPPPKKMGIEKVLNRLVGLFPSFHKRANDFRKLKKERNPQAHGEFVMVSGPGTSGAGGDPGSRRPRRPGRGRPG